MGQWSGLRWPRSGWWPLSPPEVSRATGDNIQDSPFSRYRWWISSCQVVASRLCAILVLDPTVILEPVK